MNKENCASKLVDEIILYYDARSKKHHIKKKCSYFSSIHVCISRMVTAVFKGLHSLLAATRALMTEVKITKAFSIIIKMGQVVSPGMSSNYDSVHLPYANSTDIHTARAPCQRFVI